VYAARTASPLFSLGSQRGDDEAGMEVEAHAPPAHPPAKGGAGGEGEGEDTVTAAAAIAAAAAAAQAELAFFDTLFLLECGEEEVPAAERAAAKASVLKTMEEKSTQAAAAVLL